MKKLDLARTLSLSTLLFVAAGSFVACGGDDDWTVADDDADDDVSSSGSKADGGSSSSSGTVTSSSSSSGSTSSSSGSTSSSGSAPTFAVGGALDGLTGPAVVLQNNGGNDLTVTSNGAFQFSQELANGAAYDVSVRTQPAGNRCTVQDEGHSGTIAGADVTGVVVSCVPSFTVGGTVSGLKGSLGLKNNGGAASVVAADGAFTLPGGLIAGESYAVSIDTQPLGQLCSVADGTQAGTIDASNVATVVITCRDLDIAVNEFIAVPGTGHWGDTNGDGVRNATADEFVEIMNDEDFEVDIGGMQIRTGVAADLASRFTFPVGTTLASKGRAVVFGGGVPTGSFGTAQLFVLGGVGLKLTDVPAAPLAVRLQASDTFVLDEVSYQNEFAGCSTGCASRTRSPETPGSPLVAHSDVAGAGVLTSPGVAPTAAVPKLLPAFGLPAQAPTPISVTSTFLLQFNMTMNVAELTVTPQLTLGTCAAPGVASATLNTSERLGSAARVAPASLAYASTYCLSAGALHGAAGAPLDTTIATSLEFSTRAAASAPAAGIVISQVGVAASNNEFVELYNASAAPIDISGWFLQRRTAGGTATCLLEMPATPPIAAHSYFLVATPSYVNAVTADVSTMGTSLTGTSESVVLLSGGVSCTAGPTLATRVDAVSYGTITDSNVALMLPAFTSAVPFTAVRRKACYDSSADATATGVLGAGGQASMGSGEAFGVGDTDLLGLAVAAPHNKDSGAQLGVCPQ